MCCGMGWAHVAVFSPLSPTTAVVAGGAYGVLCDAIIFAFVARSPLVVAVGGWSCRCRDGLLPVGSLHAVCSYPCSLC